MTYSSDMAKVTIKIRKAYRVVEFLSVFRIDEGALAIVLYDGKFCFGYCMRADGVITRSDFRTPHAVGTACPTLGQTMLTAWAQYVRCSRK